MPVATQRIDCLVEMLEEMRTRGAGLFFDADRREVWFDAVAQLVQALRTRDQQLAWVALIAIDLCMVMPEVSLACSAAWVQARLGIGMETRL